VSVQARPVVRPPSRPDREGQTDGSTPLSIFPVPAPSSCAVLRPWVLYPSWAACLVVLAAWLAAPRAVTALQYTPLALSVVLFGLPHGALDHLVPSRLRRQAPTPRRVLPLIGGYLGLVAAYLLLWFVAPVVALTAFLVIALLHWGQGDCFVLLAFLRRPPPRTMAGMALLWLVRGALPIAFSALMHPAAFTAAARGISRTWGSYAAWTITPAFQAGGLAVFAALVLGYVVLAVGARRHAPAYLFWTDLGETALLFVFFWVVPPLVAVGVYFCLWHSTRHIARLVLCREANLGLIERRRVPYCLRGVARDAVPMTLGAIAIFFVFAVPRSGSLNGLDGLIWLYLALVAALTLPHVILVLWMDYTQKLWPARRGVFAPIVAPLPTGATTGR